MAHTATVFQLGMDLDDRVPGPRGVRHIGSDAPRKAQEEVSAAEAAPGAVVEYRRSVDREEPRDQWRKDHWPKDHWIMREGRSFAGRHLIIDLWGGERLDDLEHVERTLIDAVEAAGATLLHIHLHHFTPNGGVSGVAVLAESHISIHSWPEKGYAALDVFMCGDAEPDRTVPVLRSAFKPTEVVVSDLYRGEESAAGWNGQA